MADLSSAAAHRWTFYRISGLDQVALQTVDDLRNLKFLDQKLWVALACPVKGLEIDERTLTLLDTDKNGRIRVPEIIEAIEWCAPRLKSLDALVTSSGDLPLDKINDATPEGKILLSSAKQVLSGLGKIESSAVSPADTADTKKIFANTRFNGDGIVPADASDDPVVRVVIEEIISLYGAETDRSQKPGVNQAKVDAFFADITSYLAWQQTGMSKDIQSYGEQTPAAFAAVKVVRAKVDDYFARCSLATFDPRALSALNRQESEYLVVASKDLTLSAEEMTGFPIARVEANRPLPLTAGLNPAWAGPIEQLRKQVVVPTFGPEKITLSAEEWTQINSRLATFERWQATRPASPIEKLGLPRIESLATSTFKQAIDALITQDKALKPEALAVGDVDRLARLYRDFGTLLRNFVNFTDFYDPTRLGSFQAGRLYFDARSCDLCICVDDPAAHCVLASLSKCYIAYCDLKRGGETMKIAACFTQGDSDYLMVGRNGLFYDRKGRDWDATIIKIIDNPISIRQAFWSPYKKFVRMLDEQIAKRAAAADAKSDALLAGQATTLANADKKPADARRVDVGTVAALGVALGALTTALGYVLGFFKGLPWWEVPLVFVGVMLIISTPSMIIAWLKLRQRTLGPILDATGWAVNARVKINIPFGTSLTERARLPRGSIHHRKDPFEDKAAARRRWLISVLILVALAAYGVWAYQTHHWPFQPDATRQPEQKPVDPVTPKAG